MADVASNTPTPEIHILTGSSEPAGGPPSFEPVSPPSGVSGEGWQFRKLMQNWAGSAVDHDTFFNLAAELEEQTVEPPMPEALLWQFDDLAMPYSLDNVHRDGFCCYAKSRIIDRLRTLPQEGRVGEIVNGFDAWRAETEAAEAASGFAEARRLETEAARFNAELRPQIFNAPVGGLDGVLHKVLVYSWFMSGDQKGGLPELENEVDCRAKQGGWDTAMEVAIIRDLARILVARGITVRSVAARGYDGETQPDQRALHAYREWLHYEGRLLGMELNGKAGSEHIPVNTAAAGFHFPVGKPWTEIEQPSRRAERMLGLLGIDWRADNPVEGEMRQSIMDATAGRSAA